MNAVVQTTSPKLLSKIAAKYSVDPDKMLTTLKATAFKAEKPVTNEQMMALLIVLLGRLRWFRLLAEKRLRLLGAARLRRQVDEDRFARGNARRLVFIVDP